MGPHGRTRSAAQRSCDQLTSRLQPINRARARPNWRWAGPAILIGRHPLSTCSQSAGRNHPMIGLVLAAGAGRRLRPYTDTLPKALVPVDGETTILDIALRNLAAVGLTDVTIVVGYRANAVEERKAAFEDKYGVRIS